MTRPRSEIVSLDDTPNYHCVSRCVRRAFLCGDDRYSGKNFDHRKPWLVDRLKLLGEVFAIDIAAYAVMSNHYHVVLHVNPARAREWSRDEVIQRWTRLYGGHPLAQQYLRGELESDAEFRQLDLLVVTWRERLTSISWFMRCLNEYIAKRANEEDECTGRFWEGRFKSRALLDEAALLSCMTYVDLNPVRAGLCETLDESAFTSIQTRIRAAASEYTAPKETKSKALTAPGLMPFRTMSRCSPKAQELPLSLEDYVELVEWTGKIARVDKQGLISREAPSALSNLKLKKVQWRMLALEIQQDAIIMFNGLDKLAARERRPVAKTKAA